MYKRVTKVVAQNIPWVAASSLRDIALPTDFPISKINIRLAGIPSGSVGGAGTNQNAFWPALANALGLITIEGNPLDGSDGVQIRNVAAGALWFRDWMMNKVQPEVTDIDPAVFAAACAITVPISFLDKRLPEGQQLITSLEAPRYGGGNAQALNLKIQTGNLTAATGLLVDQVAIVGGSYTNPAAGTLAISVSVEQLVPLPGSMFPGFNTANALPFMDLALEYIPNAAIAQNNSNSFVLNKRGIQAETFFFDADRDSDQIEAAVNNLGITPNNVIEEMLGTQQINKFDPNQMRAANLASYLPAAAAFPTGVYAVNDWHSNVMSSYHLFKQAASHTWNLNMGPTSLDDSILRTMHVTYNPSRKLRQNIGV